LDPRKDRLNRYRLYEIVDSLPPNGDANKLYLVPATSTENGNILEEWLWANNKWELVGTKKVDIDLTPYAKKDDVIAKTEKGKEKGVATLDEKGKVPKDQLPDDLIFGENGLSEEWKLIGETTVKPDEDGGLPQGVYFSLNSDGNPFKLKRAKVIVLTDTKNGDVYTDNTVNIQMRWDSDPTKWNRAMWISGVPIVANKASKVIFDVEVVDGVAYARGITDTALGAYSNSQYAGSKQVYGGLGVTLATEWIEEIGVGTYSAHFTEGTKVLVYGIPADAISNGGSGGSSLPEGFNPDDYVKNDELDNKLKDYVNYVDDNKGTKLYLHRFTTDDGEITFLSPLSKKCISQIYGTDIYTWEPDNINSFNMRFNADGTEYLIVRAIHSDYEIEIFLVGIHSEPVESRSIYVEFYSEDDGNYEVIEYLQ
jgi:hypothetical protein